MPVITHILEAKGIFTHADAYSSDIENKNEDMFEAIGKTKLSTSDKVNTAVSDIEEVGFFENIFASVSYGAEAIVDSSLNVLDWTVGAGLGTIGSFSIYYMMPGFPELTKGLKTSRVPLAIYNGIAKGSGKILEWMAGPYGKLAGTIKSGYEGLKSKAGGALGNEKIDYIQQMAVFLINYVICVYLYLFIISTLVLTLTSALIAIKIIYFFIEIIIVFFISMAVMLWVLMFDKQKATSTVGEFFYKIAILSMSPISIVLSVYVYMFSKGALFWLYGMMSELMLYVSIEAGDEFDGSELIGSFSTLQAYAVYSIG
ncbi:MAG: hypothetical protein VSS52_003035, partial [Thiotrichaceae bacterium]|nr:hypothetical protein [Thiotrichaceae bacterium]